MKLLTSLTLIGIGYLALARVGQVHRGRSHARPSAKPAEVQTWEGEGGGLSLGGQAPGVKVQPAKAEDPDLAHGLGLAG
jgi:hypothetical protein